MLVLSSAFVLMTISTEADLGLLTLGDDIEANSTLWGSLVEDPLAASSLLLVPREV